MTTPSQRPSRHLKRLRLLPPRADSTSLLVAPSVSSDSFGSLIPAISSLSDIPATQPSSSSPTASTSFANVQSSSTAANGSGGITRMSWFAIAALCMGIFGTILLAVGVIVCLRRRSSARRQLASPPSPHSRRRQPPMSEYRGSWEGFKPAESTGAWVIRQAGGRGQGMETVVGYAEEEAVTPRTQHRQRSETLQRSLDSTRPPFSLHPNPHRHAQHAHAYSTPSASIYSMRRSVRWSRWFGSEAGSLPHSRSRTSLASTNFMFGAQGGGGQGEGEWLPPPATVLVAKDGSEFQFPTSPDLGGRGESGPGGGNWNRRRDGEESPSAG